MPPSIRVFVCALVLLQAPLSIAVAAEKTPAAPSKARVCAERYIASLNMEDTIIAMMNGMMPGLMAQTPGSEAISADRKALLLETINESVLAVMPQMMEEMTPILAATFTEQEVCAMADFYGSETGRAIMAKMPEFTTKSSQLSSIYVPRMQADFLRRLCAKIDCSGSAAAPAKASRTTS
jgi:hypothetical protein